jgi:aspartyl/asparaginyl beta-hydroxylase (cupin superfamily)
MSSEAEAIAPKFYDYRVIYPFLEGMKGRIDVIRSEVEQLQRSSWLEWPEKSLYSEKDDWKVFPFHGFGVWVDKNCERCPQTTKLIREIPGLKTALFTRLGPQSKIAPHKGWAILANHVLRCHLGVIVPEKCGVWVEGEMRQQFAGDWLVFDDSQYHSGFNFSDQQRIVLLIDIERPPGVPLGRSDVGTSTELTDLVQNFGKIL